MLCSVKTSFRTSSIDKRPSIHSRRQPTPSRRRPSPPGAASSPRPGSRRASRPPPAAPSPRGCGRAAVVPVACSSSGDVFGLLAGVRPRFFGLHASIMAMLHLEQEKTNTLNTSDNYYTTPKKKHLRHPATCGAQRGHAALDSVQASCAAARKPSSSGRVAGSGRNLL